jgi:CheY-like chemotaxis protein
MAGIYKKVLVVEDDNMLRNLITEQMRNHFQIVTAQDGEEALQKIQAEIPDLVILDLLLPKIKGLDVLQQLRNSPNKAIASIPVVVLSNLSDESSIKTAQEYGISEYFLKGSVTLSYMSDRVSSLLAQS